MPLKRFSSKDLSRQSATVCMSDYRAYLHITFRVLSLLKKLLLELHYQYSYSYVPNNIYPKQVTASNRMESKLINKKVPLLSFSNNPHSFYYLHSLDSIAVLL
jgi:hypothetical protein